MSDNVEAADVASVIISDVELSLAELTVLDVVDEDETKEKEKAFKSAMSTMDTKKVSKHISKAVKIESMEAVLGGSQGKTSSTYVIPPDYTDYGEDLAEFSVNSEETSEPGSICRCGQDSSTTIDSDIGPTASEVLHAKLVDHEYYDSHENKSMYDDSLGSVGSRLNWDNVGDRIEPFILERNYGYNLSVQPISLMTQTRHEIFFVSSHKGVIYNYKHQQERFIHGHNNPIVSASIESCGKYLVTSDVGENSTIMFTDTTTCEAVFTIYNEDQDFGALLVGISPNGKYLISVHPDESPVIKLWFWTYGDDKPDDIYMYPGRKTYGDPKRISFHPNVQEFAMVAFEKQVVFLKLDAEKKIFEEPVIPKLNRRFGTIVDCTMARSCHECFTCTSEGYIQVFGNAIYMEDYAEHEASNAKFFVKAIKVSTQSLVFLQSIDGYLVVIDEGGFIQFYDTGIRLLFWILHTHEISKIQSVSFTLTPRMYVFDDPFNLNNEIFTMANPLDYLELQPEDRVPEIEILYKNTVPSAASLEHLPFITRCHISAGSDGKIYLTDLVRNERVQITDVADAPVASIDCCDERSYLIIAYVNGRVSLYNFETYQLIVSSMVFKEKTLCYTKMSPLGLFFSVATVNGEIWFLNMVLEPDPPKPHHITNRQIMKICFSSDSLYCAYYDISNVVYLIRYANLRWNYVGKMRTHHKQIKDIMFVGSDRTKLFTIGEDRFLIEYTVDDSVDDIIIKSRHRVEQTALPSCFMYYKSPEKVNYFLVANTEQKYKLIQESNMMCRSVTLGPSHGCYGDLALEKLMFLPQSNDKYLLFMNSCHIGIQKLPLDGNPYKYIGLIGNPNMKDFCVSGDGSYIFTCGYNDSSVLMWKINKSAVDILHRLGGSDLEPYFCLIDGGLKGWYFKEIRDLFVYMQILHQGDFYQPQTFGEYLDISELPDLLRACGFYPSDSEIQDILNDIKYRDYESTGALRKEIRFSEFVKLYVNYKPTHGISREDLHEHFKRLAKHLDKRKKSSINKDFFVEAMCQYGEPFTTTSLEKTLTTLIKHDSQPAGGKSDDHFSYLPHNIDMDKLMRNILGVTQDSVYEVIQEQEVEKSLEFQPLFL